MATFVWSGCPPEDVGGTSGYERYLEAIANPEHKRHDELIDAESGFPYQLTDCFGAA